MNAASSTRRRLRVRVLRGAGRGGQQHERLRDERQGMPRRLRSAIARGDLAGVVLPDGFVVPAGFNGDFNPGGHSGTVGEAAFLQSHGVADLEAFCAQFAK
jgi:hypothetical protein